MTDLATNTVTRMSLQEQADFVLSLHDRTFMPSDGEPAKEAYLMLTREEGDELAALGHRLARMARHEGEIRALVTGARA